MSSLSTVLCVLLCSADAALPQIDPLPRAALNQTVAEWSFDRDTDGWVVEAHCTIRAEGGLLKIAATAEDPYFHRPVDLPGGHMLLRLRARSWNMGDGRVFWTTDQAPQRGEDKAKPFRLTHDGQWHEYSVAFAAPGRLRDLRIDPGDTAGRFEIGWIRLARQQLHPLTIDRIDTAGSSSVRFSVKNHGPAAREALAMGRSHTIPGNSAAVIEAPIARKFPLEPITFDLATKGFPDVRRTIFLVHPEVPTDWLACPMDGFSLKVARDGSVAIICRDAQPVAALAPLVHIDGRVPALKLVKEGAQPRFEGEGVSLGISTAGKEVSVSIRSERPCEGPVVRALGGLQQGLLAGVEYLSKGEHSSSRLDIETDEHIRFAPDPLKVTLPLMAFVTDRASVAMAWNDTRLQPVFATPNFFDGTGDHRMALRGTKIDALIQVERLALEEIVLWAVNRKGLPPLPPAPRTRQQQWELCLKALNGPLKTTAGWAHCVEDRWPRHPFADIASTIFRLTGKAPDLPHLVPGGSHVPNGTIYFVTGRARRWKEQQEQRVRSLIAQQRPDGSYHYDGRFRRGHFEDTANGICAVPAAAILEYAWITGDRAALAAGVRTLDYMKRFDTPRGAQVWEIPLHTPDQLASAYAVWAYARGYQLTGNKEYLQQARRWALTGVPFVYLWGCHPIMLYGTPPVLGATNWQAPNWIGLPVQWVGGVYAYALTILAPHDKTLDWNHLARGILIAAEQMQFPEGPYAGLLPDSLHLESQERRPWRINPSALVSLRMVLDGEVDFLSVAVDGPHRVAAPFPVTMRNGQAHIQGAPGVEYQVLIDGNRVVDIKSQGNDIVPLP